ncbi:hypothetical protein L1987_35061 [Smallanthus sonchifolius]|uniref:Uncharacterized protein n=1 Tax=Smallanthus sonchifolius TaxID=185202 RepID=A0ACB9HVJ9_9ASTR|nr:hypothetical protein L1987_35061 [Smallanthus sonchifolius]
MRQQTHTKRNRIDDNDVKYCKNQRLDTFKVDPNFSENEKRYEDFKKTIVDGEDDESLVGDEDHDHDHDDYDDEEEEEGEGMKIRDETETDIVELRRTIYLTIMNSLDYEEAGHKILKIKLDPGQEKEICILMIECCMQEKTYRRFYGLLGERLCVKNKVYKEILQECFVQRWQVLCYVRLTKEDTSSSSRIFIIILFQELAELLGMVLLKARLTDPKMQVDFESIFPRDNVKNTRFSINFFTSIGLGGVTEVPNVSATKHKSRAIAFSLSLPSSCPPSLSLVTFSLYNTHRRSLPTTCPIVL